MSTPHEDRTQNSTDHGVVDSATTTLSMTDTTSGNTKHCPEEIREIWPDILSTYSQTSCTQSYMSIHSINDSLTDMVDTAEQATLLKLGVRKVAKKKILIKREDLQLTQPIRLKVGPQLLAKIALRQTNLRRKLTRGKMRYRVASISYVYPVTRSPMRSRRFLRRGRKVEPKPRPPTTAETMITTQCSLIKEFVANVNSAFSQLKIELDYNEKDPRMSARVLDERGGNRRRAFEEKRLCDLDVYEDYMGLIERKKPLATPPPAGYSPCLSVCLSNSSLETDISDTGTFSAPLTPYRPWTGKKKASEQKENKESKESDGWLKKGIRWITRGWAL